MIGLTFTFSKEKWMTMDVSFSYTQVEGLGVTPRSPGSAGRGPRDAWYVLSFPPPRRHSVGVVGGPRRGMARKHSSGVLLESE